MKQRHSDFTLIEMLTVISIIAVLAGLLLPAINGARTRASSAACLSNQKQVTAFILAYMNSANQLFTSSEEQNWGSALYDAKLVSDIKVLRCPVLDYTQSSQEEAEKKFDEEAKQIYGAVFRAGTGSDDDKDCFDFRGTKCLYYTENNKSTLVSPTQLVLGGCTLAFDNNDEVPTYLLDLSEKEKDEEEPRKPFGKPFLAHKNFCNFFFLDGHSESLQEAGVQNLYYPLQSGDGAEKLAKDYKFVK